MVAESTEDFGFLDSGAIIDAVLIDRIYLGLLSILSILVSYQSIKRSYHPDNRYYLINIGINILFILLIISRVSILILAVIFLTTILYKEKRMPQLIFAIGGMALAILLTLIINNDLRKQLFYANGIENKGLVENTLAIEPRAIIWDCAYQLTKNESTTWKGLGFVSTNEAMIDCYQVIYDSKKRDWFVANKYNTHNQFVDLYLASGILGIGLFIGGLLLIFIDKRKKYFHVSLLLTLVGFCFVENLFHRQIGAYYVGFILISLLIAKSSLEKEALNTH
jgi:O-antigen ligase